MLKEKIINSIIYSLILILLLFSPQAAWAAEWDEEARLRTPVINPYSYLPMSGRRPANRIDKTRKPLISVAAQTPLVVTDAEGNKYIYQNGKLRLRIDPVGNKRYYINNKVSFDKDADGKLTRRYKHQGSQTRIENEFGEVVGYQKFARGGLLINEYDAKGRLNRSYAYSGRRLNILIDVLTNSRTIYNQRAKPDREVNFHGATLAKYYYQDNGKLLYKIDNYENKTLFYEDGRRERVTYDFEGNVIATYAWTGADSYKLTDQHQNTTYVVRQRAQYETNYTGTVTKTYNWQGTKLISTTDVFKEEITSYENGLATETRYNGFLVALWKYDEQTGIFLSVTDKEGKTTYFDHGREGFAITDDDFDLGSFNQGDYKPSLFDRVVQISRKYKDTAQSIMTEVEDLLDSLTIISGTLSQGENGRFYLTDNPGNRYALNAQEATLKAKLLSKVGQRIQATLSIEKKGAEVSVISVSKER